ncbi:MAG: phosphoadenylyl-sulfate reductase [Rubrivivax sp.]
MLSAIELHAQWRPGFEGRVAQAAQCLREVSHAHPGKVVLMTSLGAEDMVVTDLIVRLGLPIPLATLQTGRLHAETLALIPRIEAHYGLTVERWLPQAEAVLHFVARHGEMAMRDSVALRKGCCALRKLEPLARALAGRTAWVTGLRREQSTTRAQLPLSATDDGGRTKLSPLADWQWADVWHYIAQHRVPTNALHDAHYPSIGCEPCTRAVSLGEDPRSGRWWWENEAAKECGLHARPYPRAHA